MRVGVLGDDAGGGGGGNGATAGKLFKPVGQSLGARTSDLERGIFKVSSAEATKVLLSLPSISTYLSFRRNKFRIDPVGPPGEEIVRFGMTVGAKLRSDPN